MLNEPFNFNGNFFTSSSSPKIFGIPPKRKSRLKILVVTKTFPIFVHDKSTNEDMTRTGTINNALNMRGLQEITPPQS